MKYIILALCLLTSSAVFCDASEDLLNGKLQAMHSLSANFKQVIYAKGQQVSQSSGNMALQRPGRFRWHTKSPMEQLIIADGKKLWIYDVDLEQVAVKKQEKGLGGTAALFLSGSNEDITRDFRVTHLKKGSALRFTLKPKSTRANFQDITLVFTNDTLTALELYDQLGQKTRITFSKIQTNPKLPTKLFQMPHVKGVDVVNQ